MPRRLSGLRTLLCSCSRCATSGRRSRAMNDLVMLIPELILSGMSLVLLLVARRIQRTRLAAAATVLAALAAALASMWILSQGRNIAFGGMLVLDGYSQFFKVLIAATLALAPLLFVAIGSVAAGLAFKIAAVPLHSWAPDAYQGASTPVAAFLAAGSKAVGLAALGRVCLAAYGSEAQVLSVLLTGLAGLSIIVGSVIALSQTDMKRMLAYSSISHAGYALLGLIAGTSAGASATMTYAFFYVFMTLGAF